MPAPPAYHLPLIAILGFGALIVWRIYRRVRRMVGRQGFRPVRSWTLLIIFPILILSLLVGLYAHPLRAGVELAGVAIGVVLAFYGLRLTKFEVAPDGLYYTPNAHIGITLSLLLMVRIVYRFVQINLMSSSFAEPPQALIRTPLTLLIIGTLAGYYAWYALGLIRWARSARKTKDVASVTE